MKQMVEHLDHRALEEGKSGFVAIEEVADKRKSHLRRGWYWGSQEFAERMLSGAEKVLKKGSSRANVRSLERMAHGEKEAEKLLKEGLAAAGLEESELKELPANERRKVAIARVLWSRTTVSQGWIAERIKMKQAANVSLTLHRMKDDLRILPPALVEFLKVQENAP